MHVSGEVQQQNSFLTCLFLLSKRYGDFLLIISLMHVNRWLNREFPFSTSVIEMDDLVCGLLKQGTIIHVLFRSCAQREEGQNGLLWGTRGWKLNQPDLPSYSVEREQVNCVQRDFA